MESSDPFRRRLSTSSDGVPNNTSRKSRLDFYNRSLTQVPQTVLDSNKITIVSFEKNYLENIDLLTKLPSLKELYLSFNLLKTLPPSISELTALQKLSLNNNQLLSLPQELCFLPSLKVLLVAKNKLEELPPTIFHLTKLRELDAKKNNLVVLPSGVCSMDLKKLELQENPNIKFPPKNICAQGSQATIKFIKQAKKEIIRQQEYSERKVAKEKKKEERKKEIDRMNAIIEPNHYPNSVDNDSFFGIDSITSESAASFADLSDFTTILASQSGGTQFFLYLQSEDPRRAKYLEIFHEIQFFKDLELGDPSRSEVAQRLFYMTLLELDAPLHSSIRWNARKTDLMSAQECEHIRCGLKEAMIAANLFGDIEHRLIEELKTAFQTFSAKNMK